MFSLNSTQWKVRRRRWLARQTNVTASGRLATIAKILAALILGHIVAMVWFEGLSVWDAMWLTMTTVTTVGYGDISASTKPGQLATIVFMYVAGITVLAQLAGEYVDYRLDRRERMINGKWRWKSMRDHILIINTPATSADRYLFRLITQIRSTPEFADDPIQILTRDYADGLPREIREMGVVHRCGIPENKENLEAVNIEHAKYILVLANDANDHRSDSVTLDVLEHIQSLNSSNYIVAEAVLDDNKDRFKRYGAHSVLRPVRAYPEILVRAIASPGTEEILENLFTHYGIHAHRFDVPFKPAPWAKIANQIMKSGCGTVLGYVNLKDEVVTNPDPNSPAEGKALIVMVSQENLPKPGELQRSLEKLA